MGWKRFEYGRYRCPCGRGHFVVDIKESDNGYSGDIWFERLECPVCDAAGYVIESVYGHAGRYRLMAIDGTVYEYPPPA